MKVFVRTLSAALILLVGVAKEGRSQTAPASAAQPVDSHSEASTPIVTASASETTTIVLKTSLSSKSSRAGAQIKATLRKPITLPGTEELPRGALLLGHVVQVSPHAKGKPNGAMLLTFDQAKLKSGGSLPVTVRISALAASADAANESVALPGARVGGSANAGGSQQLTFENNDKTTLHSNIKQSGLEGVYLQPSPGGSGVVFAANGDVYLDANIQMVVQIASASAKTQ